MLQSLLLWLYPNDETGQLKKLKERVWQLMLLVLRTCQLCPADKVEERMEEYPSLMFILLSSTQRTLMYRTGNSC